VRTLAIILAVWFTLSVAFGTLWALCGMAHDRREREARVLDEAERIANAEYERIWG